MPKQTKKDLQELLLEQITLNIDLALRLQGMEARMQNMANDPIPRPIFFLHFFHKDIQTNLLRIFPQRLILRII